MKSFIVLLLCIICTKTPAFVVYENTKIWNQDSIMFYFTDGTQQQQNDVKKFAKIWQKYTGIQFKYSNKKPSFFSFKKFYKITFKGSSNESTKGAVNGLIQFGNLAEDPIYRKTTILHEFGHMLGLAHEHQRADRPTFLDNPKLIDDCITNQKQSRHWCQENLGTKIHKKTFIQSAYDPNSIMHYDLKSITDTHASAVKSNENNSLSYTDKYYIALLYNQDISEEKLKKMHQQDLWLQQKFENEATIKKEKKMAQLTTQSCKTLKHSLQSKDGKYCNNGFMIIGKDNLSIPGDDYKNCYDNLKLLQEKIQTLSMCQLTLRQLKYKRKQWNNEFATYGNCKRLEPLEKNNQEFYCQQGFSFVTRFNDLIGEKTVCYGSEESVYFAMQENSVCNMNAVDFEHYIKQQQRAFKQQTSTEKCSVVKKKYRHISCPENFEYTIINKANDQEPLNSKCFATTYQAINAMKNISFCQ